MPRALLLLASCCVPAATSLLHTLPQQHPLLLHALPQRRSPSRNAAVVLKADETKGALGGAVLGGLLAGPFGALWGAQIGGSMGANARVRKEEEEALERMGLDRATMDAAQTCGVCAHGRANSSPPPSPAPSLAAPLRLHSCTLSLPRSGGAGRSGAVAQAGRAGGLKPAGAAWHARRGDGERILRGRERPRRWRRGWRTQPFGGAASAQREAGAGGGTVEGGRGARRVDAQQRGVAG